VLPGGAMFLAATRTTKTINQEEKEKAARGGLFYRLRYPHATSTEIFRGFACSAFGNTSSNTPSR
jgi:hypothetical protein